MSEFSAAWLALRETVDSRSRSEEFAGVVCARLSDRPLHALDLGTGTGANIRYLAPRLGGEQFWQAIDHNPLLIKQQPLELKGLGFHCSLSTHLLDLNGEPDTFSLTTGQLVTASALLDLVSAQWLEVLAKRCSAAAVTVLFALTYDGRIECSPQETDDAWVRNLINQHQLGDKGFGTALGPAATHRACIAFQSQAFDTFTTPTDWVLEPEEHELQRELIEGWSAAASELALHEEVRILEWRRRRVAHLDAGRSRIRVGHQDFIAYPKCRLEERAE